MRTLALGCLFTVCLPAAVGAEPAGKIGLYVSTGDDRFATALQETAPGPPESVVRFAALNDAVHSGAETLVLVMARNREPLPKRIVNAVRDKKVIGIGYGAAELFGQLGLEINGGACAHFGNDMPPLVVPPSLLLGTDGEPRQVSVYRESTPSDNFGMFIPPYSDLRQFVDVIARSSADPNYAPIVRQGNCILIGLPAHPDAWTDDYRSLLKKVTEKLVARKRRPFAVAEYDVLEPGTEEFILARSQSASDPFSRTFYFRFREPTRFSATLIHAGSSNMMLLFSGDNSVRRHWTRKDARNGEPITLSCTISAEDIGIMKNRYWKLKIANFDRNATADCVLNVDYGLVAEVPE